MLTVNMTEVLDIESMIKYGHIDRARAVLVRESAAAGTGLGRLVLASARVEIELGKYGVATRILRSAPAESLLAADVVLGDVLARTGAYDDHYELVFRLARSYDVVPAARAALAVQTGELAVLAANDRLAMRLFDFALTMVTDDPLLRARAAVGCTLAGLVAGNGTRCAVRSGSRGASEGTPSPADLLEGVAAHLNPTTDPDGRHIASTAESLERCGLVDLGRRLRALRAVWMTGRVDPTLSVLEVARCPWITSAMLQRRLERAAERDFDLWAEALEVRLAHGPHPSLVNETSDVIDWSQQIYAQHQDNVRLATAVGRAQAGWRELANLTSNEIRGLLTSLEVVTDLRQVGAHPPPGLELALVNRVAALTTMTQVGASGIPSGADWPVESGVAVADLVADIIDGCRPIFDWTGRSVTLDHRIAADVGVDVHPGLFSDMVRWLLISASTGSLRAASIEVQATTLEGRLWLTIHARTPEAPVPEHDRELGLGPEATAHRAALAILNSWGGSFSASYSVSGVDVAIGLPAVHRDIH